MKTETRYRVEGTDGAHWSQELQSKAAAEARATELVKSGHLAAYRIVEVEVTVRPKARRNNSAPEWARVDYEAQQRREHDYRDLGHARGEDDAVKAGL
jgi:hypothetical protein